MSAIKFIRRGYGTTCSVCRAIVARADTARHRAWHAELTASLQPVAQAGTSHDQETRHLRTGRS